MEEEGIYYFFRHEKGKDVVVLCDSVGAHSTAAGYETVPYFPPSENVKRAKDYVSDWLMSNSIQSGKLVHTDFDFTKPRTSLLAQHVTAGDYPKSDEELFEYPGGHLTVTASGMPSAAWNRSSNSTSESAVRATFAAWPLALFTLDGYPREDQNREYLVVSAVHRFAGGDYESGVSGEEGDVTVNFEAIPSKQPYRAPLVTRKARVAGPQTAIVVGKAGEEIWTDQYGRVKVQFHWDRYGKRDENSSCWVRVGQIWAGKNWGAMHIPRIGQEVMVDFLEGDPDRPIITGRVYNGAEMPPTICPRIRRRAALRAEAAKGDLPPISTRSASKTRWALKC